MFGNFFRFVSQAFSFLLELIFAITTARRPNFRRGGREFTILLLLILIFIISISILSSSTCIFCQKEKQENFTLKSEDFKPNSQVSSSSTKVSDSNDNQNLYLVTRVIDGDTFEIASGETIRLIGIDAPETVHPLKDVECFGEQASSFLKNLLENQVISLEKDVSETDQYGRLLRYVYLDGLFVNEYLVKEGYADAVSYPPDVKYQETFNAAEKSARENSFGLWTESCVANNGVVQGIETGNQCNIKGNISWSGEKIYHLPGCEYYEKTVIDETKGEKYFCNEEEAVSAGWRRAYNCL